MTAAIFSAEEARAQLLAEVEGEVLFDPRLIRFQAGRRRDAWRGDCVASGWRAGSWSHLESTAIHLAMIAITRLLQIFRFAGDHAAAARRFNTQGVPPTHEDLLERYCPADRS